MDGPPGKRDEPPPVARVVRDFSAETLHARYRELKASQPTLMQRIAAAIAAIFGDP